MLSLLGNGELIVAEMGVVGVGINLGFVSAGVEEVEVDVDATAGFVGDATDIPIVGIFVFPGDDVIFANFAS